MDKANRKWDTYYTNIPTPTTPKVQFSPKVKVHPMVVWSFAYKAARKGPWEQCARDRERFKKRIADVEEKIIHVLKSHDQSHMTLDQSN